MKILIQSNCNGLQIRFKGALWGLIQSHDPRVQAWNNAKLQGKYVETLVGFVFLFLRRFIYTLTWQPGPQLHPPSISNTSSPRHLTVHTYPKPQSSLGIPTLPYSSTPSCRAPPNPGALAWSGSHYGSKARLQTAPLHWRRLPGLKEPCAGFRSVIHTRYDV